MEEIRVYDDVLNAPGIDTLEGRIGPLLTGDHGACHFVDMPANCYVDEHEHPTESLIYTARGQWVLCSRGQRYHIKQGSVFWFKANTPTGFEVPFDEGAYLLIFKSQGRENDDEFIDYLKGMAARLVEQNKDGTPFRMSEIPDDHPAKVYGRTLPGNNLSQPEAPGRPG